MEQYKEYIPQFRDAISLAKIQLQGRRSAVNEEQIREYSEKLKKKNSIQRKLSIKEEYFSDPEVCRMIQANIRGRRTSFAVSYYT